MLPDVFPQAVPRPRRPSLSLWQVAVLGSDFLRAGAPGFVATWNQAASQSPATGAASPGLLTLVVLPALAGYALVGAVLKARA